MTQLILPESASIEGEGQPNLLIEALVDYVNELSQAGYSMNEFTQTMQYVYNVHCFISEIETGGLSQYIRKYGWEEDTYMLVEGCFDEVNATEHLSLFQKLEEDLDSRDDELHEYHTEGTSLSDSLSAELQVFTDKFLGLDEPIRELCFDKIMDVGIFVDQEEYEEVVKEYASDKSLKAKKDEEQMEAFLKAQKASPLMTIVSALCEKAKVKLKSSDVVLPGFFDGFKSGDQTVYTFKRSRYGVIVFEDYAVLLKLNRNSSRVGGDGFLAEHIYSEEEKSRLFKEGSEKIPQSPEARLNEWLTAAEVGNLDLLQRWIDDGFDINTQDDEGDSAAIQATCRNQSKVIGILLDNGLDIEARDKIGRSLLHWAAQCHSFKVLDLLIDRGADINCRDNYGDGILHLLVDGRKGKKETVTDVFTALLRKGISLEPNTKGETLLHRAIEKGYMELVAPLVEAGCDPNAEFEGNNAISCLMWNHRIGYREDNLLDSLKDLVKHGVNVPKDALVHAPLEAFDFLIERGADVNGIPGSFTVPLMTAINEEDLEKVEYLLKAGADPNVETIRHSGSRVYPLDELEMHIRDCERNGRSTDSGKTDEIRKRLIEAGSTRG